MYLGNVGSCGLPQWEAEEGSVLSHAVAGGNEAHGRPCWGTGVWGGFQAGLESWLLTGGGFTRC